MTTAPDVPTVGVVGAGQLARMMAEAASPLGIDLWILARHDEPAGLLEGRMLRTGHGTEALADLAGRSHVVTLDREDLPREALEALEATGHPLRPGSEVLDWVDKAIQRERFAAAGVPVPPFAVVTSVEELAPFADEHGWPLVLKAATGGYDGRGVWVVDDADQAAEIIAGVGDRVVVEPRLDLVAELAVLVARRPGGERAVYPVVETVQRGGICDEVLVPARVEQAVVDRAAEIGGRVADLVGSVGMLAIEMFVTADGVTVNELAPRPHNSGHLTIEACATSQFENHLRAVLDWPLGATDLRVPAAVMVNVLGNDRGDDPRHHLPAALGISPEAHVHLYGKVARAGRKLGHVTAIGPDVATAQASARAAEQALTAPTEEQTT